MLERHLKKGLRQKEDRRVTMNYYTAMCRESRKMSTSMKKLGYTTKQDLYILTKENFKRDLIWYLAHTSGKETIMVLSDKMMDVSFDKDEAVSEYTREHTIAFTQYPELIKDEGTKGGVFCIVDNTRNTFDVEDILNIESRKLVLLDSSYENIAKYRLSNHSVIVLNELREG